MFTGTYDLDPSQLYDADLGALHPSLVRKRYASPLVSLGAWAGLTMGVLILGSLRFQAKEVG
jgi:hypothetical protein